MDLAIAAERDELDLVLVAGLEAHRGARRGCRAACRTPARGRTRARRSPRRSGSGSRPAPAGRPCCVTVRSTLSRPALSSTSPSASAQLAGLDAVDRLLARGRSARGSSRASGRPGTSPRPAATPTSFATPGMHVVGRENARRRAPISSATLLPSRAPSQTSSAIKRAGLRVVEPEAPRTAPAGELGGEKEEQAVGLLGAQMHRLLPSSAAERRVGGAGADRRRPHETARPGRTSLRPVASWPSYRSSGSTGSASGERAEGGGGSARDPGRRRASSAAGASGRSARIAASISSGGISWPWLAPAAREIDSFISVPPRSLAPARSAAVRAVDAQLDPRGLDVRDVRDGARDGRRRA